MFEVGDKVVCEAHGVGTVTSITQCRIYPVTVTFSKATKTFTLDGFYTASRKNYTNWEQLKITKQGTAMSKPQCTTQAEVFEQFARVSKMIEGTSLRLADVTLTSLRLADVTRFAGVLSWPVTEMIGKPSEYSFALAIVEDKPVFPGDTLYSVFHKRKVTITGIYCKPNSAGISYLAIEGEPKSNACTTSLTWQEPKRTFMLNGEELPMPHDKGNWYLYFDKFSWKNEEDRDRVQAVIEKLLRGESK